MILLAETVLTAGAVINDSWSANFVSVVLSIGYTYLILNSSGFFCGFWNATALSTEALTFSPVSLHKRAAMPIV